MTQGTGVSLGGSTPVSWMRVEGRQSCIDRAAESEPRGTELYLRVGGLGVGVDGEVADCERGSNERKRAVSREREPHTRYILSLVLPRESGLHTRLSRFEFCFRLDKIECTVGHVHMISHSFPIDQNINFLD